MKLSFDLENGAKSRRQKKEFSLNECNCFTARCKLLLNFVLFMLYDENEKKTIIYIQ